MRTIVLSLVVVLVAGCTEPAGFAHVERDVEVELDAFSCTTTLVQPANGWTVQAGDPVPLSATASCSGGTPEFEYWYKHVGDQNWQVVTPAGTLLPATSGNILANYVPGASSFAPSVAADACFMAVARPVGSTLTFEGKSGAVCGTVTGTTTTPPPSSLPTLLLGGGNAVALNSSIIRTAPDNVLTVGSTALQWTIPLHAGDRIMSGSVALTGDGLVDLTTIAVDVVSVTDEVTTLVSGSLPDVPAARALVPFAVPSPVILGDSDRAVLRIVASAGGLSVGAVSVTYDHPAL